MVNWRTWHRRIALVALPYILFSTLSGALHIVMSYSKRSDPMETPGISKETINLLNQRFQLRLQEGVKKVAVVSMMSRPYFQIIEKQNKPLYISLENFVTVDDGDKKFALDLVSKLKPEKEISKIDYLTSFTPDYPAIFRVLPVYRIVFTGEDEEKLFLSTHTQGVTSQTNKWKEITSKLFSIFHKLSFIEPKSVRDLIQSLFLILIVATVLSGILLFPLLRKKKN
jgi:hypothetical protein